MELGPLLTSWTIRIALVLYVIVVIGELVGPQGRDDSTEASRRWNRVARALWTGGLMAFLVHLASAFHFYHAWSHQAAFDHTAAETDRLLGVEFGWGIYFNHLFTLIWLADVLWWWIDRQGHDTRARTWNLAMHAFMAFIALNGAVIFESGPTRWVGVPITLLLAGLFVRKLRLAHE